MRVLFCLLCFVGRGSGTTPVGGIGVGYRLHESACMALTM